MALAFFTAECLRLNWREQEISASSSPRMEWSKLRMWQIELWPSSIGKGSWAQVCHVWNNCPVIIHKVGSHRPCFWLKAAVSAVLDAGFRAVLKALKWGQAPLRIQLISRSWWSPVSAWFPHFTDYNTSLQVSMHSSRVTHRLNTETTCELYVIPILSSSGKQDFWIISLHLGILIFPNSHFRWQDRCSGYLWGHLCNLATHFLKQDSQECGEDKHWVQWGLMRSCK